MRRCPECGYDYLIAYAALVLCATFTPWVLWNLAATVWY